MHASRARPVRRWGPLPVVAVAAFVGAASTLAVATFTRMSEGELVHLGQLLLPAAAATIVAASIAVPLLSRAPVGRRLVALALMAVVVSVANLAVLAALMLVRDDALLVSVLIGYSAAAGVGVALALSSSFRLGIQQIVAAAKQLGEGKLSTRIGRARGGPELEQVARTLDDMAARLEDTIAREQRAVAARNDLITAVSHDLRTPLAGLRAMVEAIDDRVVDDRDTLRRYASEMRRSIDALVVLVDDLFELVQLDPTALRAETDRAPLDQVVRSALDACGAQAAEKRVLVETRLNGTDEALISPRLARVLQNLLQNAIRHTPPEGTVRIDARRDANAIEVAVEDTGEGIPGPTLERVFEPFWRGDEARSQRGSGLGLALAKRIVEVLGGELSVQSRSGEGSRFALVVPAGENLGAG